jgi:3-deoxy-D-manno-octulosonic-acid transferase
MAGCFSVSSSCHHRLPTLIWIYRLLFPFVLLATAPYYLWRMRRRGGYGDGFWHRFGLPPRLPARRPGVRRVWLQAVSVGEMLAVEPIVLALEADGIEVMLTTTTSTGYRVAVDRLLAHVCGIAYFPMDWMPFSSRAWARISPDLAIVTEGERWPEHMNQAKARGVPVLCINARISDRSFRRLRRFPVAAAFVLDGMTRILAGSAQDARRFREMGYPADRITVTGNIKLDVKIPRLDEGGRAKLRLELGLPPGRLVLLGSSTWPGEEAALVDALLAARSKGVDCSLLIVPRHAERRAEIEKLLKATGLSLHMRSRGASPGAVDVAVGDTTGELRAMTQLADVVFVGKSLSPHTEGQTPVEAAALGRPILFGPGMGNFRSIARDLLERGAARSVADAAGLCEQAAALLQDPAQRDLFSAAAASWRGENGGAVDRTLAAILGEFQTAA